MLHEQGAHLLREEVVGGGGSAGHAEQDLVGGGEAGEGLCLCGRLGEDGHGVGDLALVGEGDGDVDEGVVVLRDEELEGRVAGLLDGGVGAVEPLLGDAEGAGVRAGEAWGGAWGWEFGGEVVGGVGRGEGVVREGDVGHVGGDGAADGDGVVEVGEGERGHAPVGWLEAVEAAVVGGDADGAAAVGADYEGDQA